MTSHQERKDVAAKRSAVLAAIVDSVQHGEPREYHIALVGYYIEGMPYPATGLGLGRDTPADIDLTAESLRCTAFFQPHRLDPRIVLANGIIQKYIGDQVVDVVPVRLEVKLDDVWGVAEFIKGQQHDLFLDPETVQSRLMSFPSESH